MKFRYLHYLKSILYWEPSFICKYYLHKKNMCSDWEYVFMADGKIVHGGLFDRLKGAISIYALSKIHHKKFGIDFKTPFPLEKFLEPNQFDWVVKDDDLVYDYPKSRPVIAYSELRHPFRLMRNRTGQTHYYFGGNILAYINKKYNRHLDWICLYNELFKPSAWLQNEIKEKKVSIGGDYVAVHLRFLDALGDNLEKLKTKVLTPVESEKLIHKCLNDIEILITLYLSQDMKVVIFSDSMIFLNIVEDKLPKAYIIHGNIKHLDNVDYDSEDAFMKVFLDMYLMAGAKKVYSIVNKGMYQSDFPLYSAMIGKVPFERLGNNVKHR